MVHDRRSGRRGFTLVELLVVVSIIALLVAVLLPSLSKARKHTRAVVCRSGMRSLSMASFTYLAEWGVYPPSLSNVADSSDAETRATRYRAGIDWLGIGDQSGAFVEGDRWDPYTGNPEGFTACPRFGAIWYIVKDEKSYLCSEDHLGPMEDTVLGGGGNGKFSYTIFSNMGLRKPDRIPTRLEDARGGSRGGGAPTRRLPKVALAKVPLFVEEHPSGINDRRSGGHMEGNFNFNTDVVVARHPPFSKRLGRNPNLRTFMQGMSNIGFGDGHVEALPVNYGYTDDDVKPTSAGGQGLEGIPYTAKGLLYHFGIEYRVIDAHTGEEIIP